MTLSQSRVKTPAARYRMKIIGTSDFSRLLSPPTEKMRRMLLAGLSRLNVGDTALGARKKPPCAILEITAATHATATAGRIQSATKVPASLSNAIHVSEL